MINCKQYFTGLAGGIAAVNFGNIISCTNNGIIYSSGHTGGIAGINFGTISNCDNYGMICYSYIANRSGEHRSVGGIAGINNNSISNSKNMATILYGNYTSLNDVLIQPRMAHIAGSDYGTITGSTWTSAGSINKGFLITFSWTENGVTYSHNQAQYVRNAAVGLY